MSSPDGRIQARAVNMEDRLLPMQQVPLSTSLVDPKEQQVATVWH